jgi:hypothetical protein
MFNPNLIPQPQIRVRVTPRVTVYLPYLMNDFTKFYDFDIIGIEE